LHTVAYIVKLGFVAWLYKRGGVWWLGWRHGGKQYLRSTGHTEREKAELEKQRIDAMSIAKKTGTLTDEFFALLTGKAIPKISLEDYLSAWLKEAESFVMPASVNKYKQVVREFLAHTRAKETGLLVPDVTPDQVRDFLSEKRLKLSGATVAGFRRILRSIFLQAQEEGKIQHNPVPSANRKSRGKGQGMSETRKRPFTLEELRDLHKLADEFWRFMIRAGFYTGQRMGDLITLRRESVDVWENVIRLTSRKTQKRVVIPMKKPLRDLLASFPPGKPTDFFWPEQAERYLTAGPSSFSQEFNELLGRAGLVKPRDRKKESSGKGRGAPRTAGLGFHCLRHTFVTLIKATGGSQAVAKELAGHTTDAISDLYTHLPIDVLTKAIEKMPEMEK